MATASTSSQGSNFVLNISDTTRVVNNSASIGGGLSLVSGNTTIGPGVTISRNHGAQGGGISISEGPEKSAQCLLSPKTSITNNTAVVAGGGIYLDAASVHINEGIARRIAQGNTAAFGPDLSLLSQCLPGEVRAGAWCQQCGANLYSFNPANTSCDICPEDATCTGGTVIIPDSGYWHSSGWSTQIHRCPNPYACNQPGLEEIYRGRTAVGLAAQQATIAHAGTLAGQPAAKGGAGHTRALLGRKVAGLFDAAPTPVARLAGQRLAHGARSLMVSTVHQGAVPAATALAAVAAAVAAPPPPAAAEPALPEPTADTNWQCAAGYAGRLCGSCTAGHGLRGPFQCARCMSRSAAVAMYVVSFVVLMVVIWFMAHVTWLDNQDANSDMRMSDILKVVILYVQCLVVLTHVPVEWPGSVAAVFAGLTWLFSAGNSQLLSFDCLLGDVQLLLPVAVVRQLVYLLAPVAMFIAVVLLQCCVRLGHRAWRLSHKRAMAQGVLSEVWGRIPVIAIVTLMFFYPSLIHVALSMFACYPIDTAGGLYPQYAVANASRGYWQYDMQQACWEGWHRSWALGLGLPFTAIFCVGVPLSIMLLLWFNRQRHDELSFRKHCGVLYRLYQKRCYAWEAVVAVYLVLLVLVSVFGPNLGVWHETLLLNFFFGALMVLMLMFRPYRFHRLHNIALLAVGCLSFTAYAALSFLTEISADIGRVYKEVAGAFVLVFNFGFLMWVIYNLLLLVKQFIQRIEKLRSFTRNRRKGPKEFKDGYPTDAPLGNARAASVAGAKAGAAAAKAMATGTKMAGSNAAKGIKGPMLAKPV